MIIEKHVIVGSGCVILPNTRIEIATAIGALSLVKGNLSPWSIYAGIPAKFRIKRKSSEILRLEKKLLEKYPL